jgi:SAM-dependent methyltransferase
MSDSTTRQHWNQVYASKPADSVSWFQPRAELSFAMIERAGLAPDDPIIDVGGGASVLVDQLLDAGHRKIAVLDLSAAALDVARDRLGPRAATVDWIVADITRAQLPPARYALWHDRAVFHFLTSVEARAAYRRVQHAALAPDGQLVIATFADDGPTQCSGLPVARYSAAALQAEFAPAFVPVAQQSEIHRTPWGSEQRFVYCHFRRRPAEG